MRTIVKYPVLAERLAYAMEVRDVKAYQLCQITGLDKSAVSNYLQGYFRPNQQRLALIAEALHVAPEWLDGYDVEMNPVQSNISNLKSSNLRRINLYSSISCGSGVFNDGNVEGVISLPGLELSGTKEYFAVKANGDSMTGVGIDDGDILIFEKTDLPEENKIGAFCIDNEYAICKRYMSDQGKIFLMSANDAYLPIVIEPMDDCFRCVGLLVKIIKDVQ